jgi:hypothetical protein
MRFRALAVGALALAITACASVGSLFEKNGDERYAAGMAALRSGDYVNANLQLGWVAEHYPNEEIGKRALLVVSALEMDPRNPTRRIALGSELAAAYLRLPEVPQWTAPLAQTMYLLGLELGAAEEKVAQAEAEKAQAERRLSDAGLPKLPNSSTPWPSRLRASKEETDKLAKRVEQLEGQLADREKKLAEKEKELERIRKTLKS